MAAANLIDRLRIPVIGAPMFLASGPELVIAQCRAGIMGTMPSRSVHRAEDMVPELRRIKRTLAEASGQGVRTGPFGINLVVHKSNPRFDEDFAACVSEEVPYIITSLGASRRVVDRVHDYGGRVFHDVTNIKHARKAIVEGVDGIIAVCAGAGGHSGALSPFALIREIRAEYDGFLVAGGAISDGYALAGAIAMGADCAYVGTRFIATVESGVSDGFRQMIVASGASDVFYTPWLSGVPGNFLRQSFVLSGLDPDNLPPRESAEVNAVGHKKSWSDIWSAGQGVGVIEDILTTAEIVERMAAEYHAATRRLARLAARAGELADAC